MAVCLWMIRRPGNWVRSPRKWVRKRPEEKAQGPFKAMRSRSRGETNNGD